MLSKQSEFSLFLSALLWTVYILLLVSLTLCHISTICPPFASQLIMSNFSLIQNVFRKYFIWTAQSNTDLCFSINANALEEETKWATWLYHQCYQSIHMTEGITVTSPFASFLQKCNHGSSMLNCVKLKTHKNKLCSMRSACTKNWTSRN